MTEQRTPYEPDEDEFRGYGSPPEGGPEVARYFYPYLNHGVGQPHFYVCLDESGDNGTRGWWFEPEQAEALGKQIVELAQRCKRQNETYPHIAGND